MNRDSRKAVFSSNSTEWETPDSFFKEMQKEFNFTVDVCATAQNTKLFRFFDPKMDGLSQECLWT